LKSKAEDDVELIVEVKDDNKNHDDEDDEIISIIEND
jgi:hypothetical protein